MNERSDKMHAQKRANKVVPNTTQATHTNASTAHTRAHPPPATTDTKHPIHPLTTHPSMLPAIKLSSFHLLPPLATYPPNYLHPSLMHLPSFLPPPSPSHPKSAILIRASGALLSNNKFSGCDHTEGVYDVDEGWGGMGGGSDGMGRERRGASCEEE